MTSVQVAANETNGVPRNTPLISCIHKSGISYRNLDHLAPIATYYQFNIVIQI